MSAAQNCCPELTPLHTESTEWEPESTVFWPVAPGNRAGFVLFTDWAVFGPVKALEGGPAPASKPQNFALYFARADLRRGAEPWCRLVSTPDCHSGGREFKSRRLRHFKSLKGRGLRLPAFLFFRGLSRAIAGVPPSSAAAPYSLNNGL